MALEYPERLVSSHYGVNQNIGILESGPILGRLFVLYLFTMAIRSFKVPSHGDTYYNSIKERCLNLIDLNIWEGIEKSHLRQWLTNFRTDEEKYFAACVLDCLIYRSENQTEALLYQLFSRELPTFHEAFNFSSERNLIEALKAPSNQSIRLVSVMMSRDSPIKSSAVVGRILKRAFQINQNYIIRPVDVKEAYENGVRVFIFLDDFLGTGDQFIGVVYEMIGTFGYMDILRNSKVLYAPLAAHIKGIEAIRSSFPWIHIVCSELLDNAHSLFSQCFDDGVNSSDTAKEFYLTMLNSRGLEPSMSKQFGYGNFAITYAFSHAIPDNSLGVLHFNENGWTPLINR